MGAQNSRPKSAGIGNRSTGGAGIGNKSTGGAGIAAKPKAMLDAKVTNGKPQNILSDHVTVSNKPQIKPFKIDVESKQPVKVITNDTKISDVINKEAEKINVSDKVKDAIKKEDNNELTQEEKTESKYVTAREIKEIKKLPTLVKKPMPTKMYNLNDQLKIYKKIHAKTKEKSIIRVEMSNESEDDNSNTVYGWGTGGDNSQLEVVLPDDKFMTYNDIHDINNLIDELHESGAIFNSIHLSDITPNLSSKINISTDSAKMDAVNKYSFTIVQISDTLFNSISEWSFSLKGRGEFLVFVYYTEAFHSVLQWANKYGINHYSKNQIENMENAEGEEEKGNMNYIIYIVILLILVVGGALYYKNKN